MDKNSINNLNFSNKATLTYLTNPVYQNNLITTEKVIEKNKYKKSDIKFYRKRVLNITRKIK